MGVATEVDDDSTDTGKVQLCVHVMTWYIVHLVYMYICTCTLEWEITVLQCSFEHQNQLKEHQILT